MEEESKTKFSMNVEFSFAFKIEIIRKVLRFRFLKKDVNMKEACLDHEKRSLI